MLRALLFAVNAVLVPTFAAADIDARFDPFFFETDDPYTVMLRGEINARTPLTFSRLLEELPQIETVVLSSPGGSVYSALLIAREIDRRAIATVIPDGAGCYSACSFLFLAGHQRFPKGELGVHQVSSDDPDLVAGQVAVSDIVELLGEFGVSNDLILIMLRTPPDQMYVLDQNELVELGLIGPRVEVAEQVSASLKDGTYTNGGLSVVIDDGLVGVTVTEPGCIGSFDGEMREDSNGISFVGDGCTISVTKLGAFDFSMEQGRGCSDYHGARCSLSGYVRRK